MSPVSASKWIFGIAGTYGLIVLLPLFFGASSVQPR